MLSVLLASIPGAGAAMHSGLVAQYHFDEGSGTVVKDASGNGQDGVVVGGAKWVLGMSGKAMAFDGLNRVSIPSSAVLSAHDQVTITAWIKGHSGAFRLVKGPTAMRAPFFQVCGDVLNFASFADHPSGWWSANESHLVTGRLDVNLSQWRGEQRTRFPFTADEPKLQVAGSHLYYEYFGQDTAGAWQVWTAQSTADGTDYRTVQRTHEKQGLRVEQGGMQVVGNEIHYSWPQQDASNTWQTWSAWSRRDGSAFNAVQVTTDGAAFVYQQVVGHDIYYLLNTDWGKVRRSGGAPYLHSMEIAVSDRRGGKLRVLKTIDSVTAGTGAAGFQVNNGTLYLAYVQANQKGEVNLFTGSMRTDGSGFRAIERSLGTRTRGMPGVPQLGIKVIGDRVYYALVLVNRPISAAEASKELFQRATFGRNGFTFWSAEAKLDGSGWRATQRTNAPPDIVPQYKSLAVTGGKIYYSLAEVREYHEPYDPFYAYLATTGSNIVNKGDAYGLGLTEWNEARAFVNAGEDYLFRAEAPADVAGAIADAAVDENWHAIAMTYDRDSLKLYVDAKLKSSSSYHAKIGENPFPIMIGDGFVGVIDEVAIYDHALSSDEIRRATCRSVAVSCLTRMPG
jgi:hypothetical protein